MPFFTIYNFIIKDHLVTEYSWRWWATNLAAKTGDTKGAGVSPVRTAATTNQARGFKRKCSDTIVVDARAQLSPRFYARPIGSLGHFEYSMWHFSVTAASPQVPPPSTRHCRAPVIPVRLSPQHKTPPTRNKLSGTYSQALQCYFIICFTIHVYTKCH